jgi:hypothetical protein
VDGSGSATGPQVRKEDARVTFRKDGLVADFTIMDPHLSVITPLELAPSINKVPNPIVTVLNKHLRF